MPLAESPAEIWNQIAHELGIALEMNKTIPLSSGDVVKADLYFEDFGGPKGMVVVERFDSIGRRFANQACDEGYGFSVVQVWDRSEKSLEPEEIQATKEMLWDWGWNGDESRKPAWFIELDKMDRQEED